MAGRARPLMVALLAVLAIVVTAVLPEAGAFAQNRPRTVLEMLFGGGNEYEPGFHQPPPQQQRAPRRVIRKRQSTPDRQQRSTSRSPSRSSSASRSASSSGRDSSQDSKQPAKKTDDARKVLVVGDFLAGSLADGLTRLYADNENVAVASHIDGSSGLVRDDHYDWPAHIGPILAEEKPDVLVVMVGSNDRQPITLGSQTLALRSDTWTQEYQKRITEMTDAARKANVPLVWVGMPSFKFDRMSEDMVFLNDLYRKGAEAVSGAYVDIWDGFVDADGQFVYSGPGVNGQQVQLRNSDGITMTDAGEDKLAFFAERVISRILGSTAKGAGALALSGAQLPNMQLPPIGNAANSLTTPLIALDDPGLDGGENLLGTATPNGFSLEPSPRDRLVVNGNGTGNVEGRADDFAWNEKSGAVVPDGPPIAYRGSLDLDKVRENSGITPPKEMPSILDAIINEWSQDNQQAKPDAK